MTRVLLCCEGVNDQGKRNFIDDEWQVQEGVVQVFFRKLAPSAEFVFVPKKRNEILNMKIARRNVPGASSMPIRLAALLKKEHCTCLAYHRDEDNKGFKVVLKEVDDYLSVARENGYPCIAIIPVHMIESWLLADEQAFPCIPVKPELPKSPEKVWGNKGADKHPKKYLERVLAQFHKKPSTEIYVEIAQASNVATMRKRCPVGFGKFSEDIARFFPV